MTIQANISQLGVEDRVHLVKAEMIERLSPYYN